MSWQPVDRLMAAYDKTFPSATPFARGAYRYEALKIIAAIEQDGGRVVFDDPPDLCPVCLQAPCAPDRPTCADWGCVLVDDERRHSAVGEDRFDRERDEGRAR